MRPALLIASLALASGCADALTRGQLTELRSRLDDAQRRQATAEHKVEELEDRVFLLTDQVESQKVASSRRESPRLPVIKLKPEENAPAADDDAERGDVEYLGDARTSSPDRVRPMLRLDESKSLHATSAAHHPTATLTASAKGSTTTPLTTPTAITIPADGAHDNLGVAAAPFVHGGTVDKGERETPPAADPLKLYRAAYDDLRAGRHDQAVRGFREFVRLFPRHDYADNAQYWLGECFYDRKQFVQAASEFRQVVSKYPLGNKAPDALLKLGYCLISVGELDRGRELLAEVPSTYPRTEAARLASERLAEMKEGPK